MKIKKIFLKKNKISETLKSSNKEQKTRNEYTPGFLVVWDNIRLVLDLSNVGPPLSESKLERQVVDVALLDDHGGGGATGDGRVDLHLKDSSIQNTSPDPD